MFKLSQLISTFVSIACICCINAQLYIRDCNNTDNNVNDLTLNTCYSVSNSIFIRVASFDVHGLYYYLYNNVTACTNNYTTSIDKLQYETCTNLVYNETTLSTVVVYTSSGCIPSVRVWNEWAVVDSIESRYGIQYCTVYGTNVTCNEGCKNNTLVSELKLIDTNITTLSHVCNYEYKECYVSPTSGYPYNTLSFFLSDRSPVSSGWVVYIQPYIWNSNNTLVGYNVNEISPIVTSKSDIVIKSMSPIVKAQIVVTAVYPLYYDGYEHIHTAFVIAGSNVTFSNLNISVNDIYAPLSTNFLYLGHTAIYTIGIVTLKSVLITNYIGGVFVNCSSQSVCTSNYDNVVVMSNAINKIFYGETIAAVTGSTTTSINININNTQPEANVFVYGHSDNINCTHISTLRLLNVYGIAPECTSVKCRQRDATCISFDEGVSSHTLILIGCAIGGILLFIIIFHIIRVYTRKKID